MAPGSMMPMRGIFDTDCCARAASGHVTAVQPSSVTNSRRFISEIRRPWHCAVGLPRTQGITEGAPGPWAELNCSESSRGGLAAFPRARGSRRQWTKSALYRAYSDLIAQLLGFACNELS